ncbi:helix-turn-helix domain-containing protein [Clostridium felsineum]|uniref:Uncharacterized protein n=1 Tax=Clostridium felsineum TaxID=36839 RepID=A0A1S8LD88_9CLOT|nr:helix-turn-helix transcriptional regulator [Clostridium felsineum]URZ05870.1 hypothetical protein CLROS_012020 [Clostridium felsineum]URZ10907.1 hypothetical protein CROST_016230 [Clostridium felsineum]
MGFKELREAKGLTIEKAAQLIGVYPQAIYRYETKKRVPTKKVLKKMYSVYECTDTQLGEAIVSNVKD